MSGLPSNMQLYHSLRKFEANYVLIQVLNSLLISECWLY